MSESPATLNSTIQKILKERAEVTAMYKSMRKAAQEKVDLVRSQLRLALTGRPYMLSGESCHIVDGGDLCARVDVPYSTGMPGLHPFFVIGCCADHYLLWEEVCTLPGAGQWPKATPEKFTALDTMLGHMAIVLIAHGDIGTADQPDLIPETKEV